MHASLRITSDVLIFHDQQFGRGRRNAKKIFSNHGVPPSIFRKNFSDGERADAIWIVKLQEIGRGFDDLGVVKPGYGRLRVAGNEAFKSGGFAIADGNIFQKVHHVRWRFLSVVLQLGCCSIMFIITMQC